MTVTDIPHVTTETLALATTLIGFDTTSRNSNLGLIEWVRDYLKGHGVGTLLIYDESGRKANLFATVGDPSAPGIVLSGHSDVVPVDGQPWTTDPFKATVVGDRLVGRGSCDMKGFIACALAAVPAMLRTRLARPFHIALSYDEEVGCLGVRHMLAEIASRGIRPAACIVGEPTGMRPVVAHKGRREMRCRVHGKAAHSSLPASGLNAIQYGAQVAGFVQRLAEREATSGPRDPGFDVPYTTMQCGRISGGLSGNTVPEACDLSVEVRNLPGRSAATLFDEVRDYIDAELVPQMRARHPDTGIALDAVTDTPGHEIAESAPLVQLVKRLTGAPKVTRVAYTTEAGLFQRTGIPTVVCGPGEIAQAHRPDEFVTLAQLAECERVLGLLVADASAL